jgi:hypothetical protein
MGLFGTVVCHSRLPLARLFDNLPIGANHSSTISTGVGHACESCCRACVSRHLILIHEDASVDNSPFLEEVYAPQTKILEGLTKDEIQIFDMLFNG